MSNNVTDVVVHIDETLKPDRLKTVEDTIHGMNGVVSACGQDDKPHLITVVYNPEQVKTHDILEKVENEGVHAELVGLL